VLLAHGLSSDWVEEEMADDAEFRSAHLKINFFWYDDE
jgi:hypothetical protein